MSDEIGKPEKVTQRRVIKLFTEQLGYRYLGDWTDRVDNRQIEEHLLEPWLTARGYSADQINRAIYLLKRDAELQGRSLYHTNLRVYERLRYGVPVKVEAGEVTQWVRLIDWEKPTANDFAVVEEVTLKGGHERRPDLVLYVNGIALAVIELKSSVADIGEGMRQLISNQTIAFNAWFFTTVQLVFAGNDSEGLRYGTVGTEEKYFLQWKEDEADNDGYKLDKYFAKMANKPRLLELVHNFVLFDGGTKKVPRVHQYFGIKAAQDYVRRREGGIIWHTQGSGKSIVMVLLAKWILENNPHARVAVITDRDELDKQIEGVFGDAGEEIYRTQSGRDLIKRLEKPTPRLLCSLVHKFGRRDVDDFEAFIKDLESKPTKTHGEVFVFVDECHRTQSGKLHRVMKAILPHAVFIGFTGTPLLKRDKQTTLEVFGRYIHTYKFSEAVEDKVVLDLIYEARDIDQKLGSEEKIDAWFDAKTKGLNEWQREELKKKWGTMQKVLSSASRMDRVVSDIVFDFSVKPRLSRERGTAILVASSIYEACRYFDLFRHTPLKNRCAIVTSYDPQAKDVSKEDTGADSETEKQFIYRVYQEVLEQVSPEPGKSRTETYEDRVKDRFIKEPATMKLLIVVNKLLTGFDAPACTYLYIDKKMEDHGLFQAICRTNRLDGEEKDFGYIVDYKDLFKKVENAIAVYSSDELDHTAGGADPQVLLQDRLKKGKERLEAAREKVALICEPVEPPKDELRHIHYFCGNTEIASDLEDREPQRVALYQATASLVRAYTNLADELESAGYTTNAQDLLKSEVGRAVKLRETIRKASGETLDLKAYEADMRHLIDTYIEAREPRKISEFDDIPLLELIVKTGVADAIAKKLSDLRQNQEAVAETIENNVRKKIIKEHLSDPAFYEKMSELLDEVIKARKEKALDYEKYLKRIGEIATKVQTGQDDQTPAALKRSPALRAIYNNLSDTEVDAMAPSLAAEGITDLRLWIAERIDRAVRRVKQDGFRGNQAKEMLIKEAMLPELGNSESAVIRMFEIIKQQSEY
ncbi:HsdR family type I site-specific deoxyribonuclease [Actomonas aquatica]|uniref:Type I restriction enzyme endonuclease subunit n=1 Tax=Actomonas aquatica TaxID=2866162 RepID=A0ABZ1C1R3_9BACT|nr:HsdR family type I site-specific deoxyribonuclease [Opitutus sp. WL0086]WRQ85556.1 HsdR family type I site-specific deoxyribonuclease [Opitutus sp. WL0086]